MSSAPIAAAVASPKTKPKTVPGWKQLSALLPYLARCKGKIAIGLVTLAAMGIVGTLQPLVFGVIMDCLSGNAQPLGRLGQTSPGPGALLIPAYQPSSARTLVIYCLVALVIVALKGVFSYLDALDSHRPLARHRVRPAQRPARPPAASWSRNFTSATAPAN